MAGGTPPPEDEPPANDRGGRGEWELFRDDAGREYNYDAATQVTQWKKTEDLVPRDDAVGWEEAGGDGDRTRWP